MTLREKLVYYAAVTYFIKITVTAYSHNLYRIRNETDLSIDSPAGLSNALSRCDIKFRLNNVQAGAIIVADPLISYQEIRHKSLFGDHLKNINSDMRDDENKILKLAANEQFDYVDDVLGHYPSGSAMQPENTKTTTVYINTGKITISILSPLINGFTYQADDEYRMHTFSSNLLKGKSAVHLIPAELMHPGHCYLKLTKDYMQTAVNAFSILLGGGVEDILQMPPAYVLPSARTIAMMKIEKEKLAATWEVVKDGKNTDQISIEVLEMYRPLFKYLNGREIARLNLSDYRILNYVGTHPDLDRHQVGVIASKYIKMNPRWMQPRHLNQMNNLLCGVSMTHMRRVPTSTYLQLNHQVFYHVKACDTLQRRFYLNMMTKTQALGKSYSWNARDVSRLGLLLSEIDGLELAQINPEAMSGITAQMLLEIPAHTLAHITDMQMRYMSQKPLNILAKKLKIYENEKLESNGNHRVSQCSIVVILLIVLSQSI